MMSRGSGTPHRPTDDEAIDAMSVRELCAHISAAGLYFADCIEMAELRQRAREASRLMSDTPVSADTLTDLMCMICLDSMEDPATLPCGHSGCKGCLERALAACGGKCPVCRTVHRGPLSTNIMLRNLLAVHHVNLVTDATLEAARREIAVLQSELLAAMEPEAEFEPEAEGRAGHELLDAEPFPRTQSQEDQMVTAAIAASLGGNHVVPPATLIPATATNEQIAAAEAAAASRARITADQERLRPQQRSSS